MGTKVGGSPTGKMHWPKPHEKSKHPQPPMAEAKKIAGGSNMDHHGGLPKGKLRGPVGGIK